MTENPYDILGVSRGASMDEVKRAYRKKARENHPDLNPDDPAAEERMNKINEAYDRIMNPEKYAASDARRRAQSGGGAGYGASSYASGYGGGAYGSGYAGNPYGNPYGGAYSNQHSSTNSQYQDYNASDFAWTTINFDDFFGGGWAAQQQPIHPEVSASDSPEFRQAITYINSGAYKNAVDLLQKVPSTGRNARWYYLFALANSGAGNTVAAHDNISKARKLDPNNPDYKRAESQFAGRAQTYTQEGSGRGFTVGGIDPTALCCCLCLGSQFCSRFFMYGFRF